MVGRTIGRGVFLLLEPPAPRRPLTCFRFVMRLAGRGLPDPLRAEGGIAPPISGYWPPALRC
jgi:hypothetical protein